MRLKFQVNTIRRTITPICSSGSKFGIILQI
jgi:hypothetical protein